MYIAVNFAERVGDLDEINRPLDEPEFFGPFSTHQHACEYLEWYRCELGVGIEEEVWERDYQLLEESTSVLVGEVRALTDPLKQIW